MVDYSGEAWANVFASEAELLLGANADKMAEYKANEDEAGEYPLILSCGSTLPLYKKICIGFLLHEVA